MYLNIILTSYFIFVISNSRMKVKLKGREETLASAIRNGPVIGRDTDYDNGFVILSW